MADWFAGLAESGRRTFHLGNAVLRWVFRFIEDQTWYSQPAASARMITWRVCMSYRCEAALIQDLARSARQLYTAPISTRICLWPGERAADFVCWSHSRHLVFLISFPKQSLYQVSPSPHLCSSLNRTPLLRDCHSRVLNLAQACDFIGVREIVNALSNSQCTFWAALSIWSVIRSVQLQNFNQKPGHTFPVKKQHRRSDFKSKGPLNVFAAGQFFIFTAHISIDYFLPLAQSTHCPLQEFLPTFPLQAFLWSHCTSCLDRGSEFDLVLQRWRGPASLCLLLSYSVDYCIAFFSLVILGHLYEIFNKHICSPRCLKVTREKNSKFWEVIEWCFTISPSIY